MGTGELMYGTRKKADSTVFLWQFWGGGCTRLALNFSEEENKTERSCMDAKAVMIENERQLYYRNMRLE